MFNIEYYLEKINCPYCSKDSFKFLKLSKISFTYNIEQTTFIFKKSE